MAEIVQADVQSLAFGISETMWLKREPIIQINCSFREQDRGSSLNARKFRWCDGETARGTQPGFDYSGSDQDKRISDLLDLNGQFQ